MKISLKYFSGFIILLTLAVGYAFQYHQFLAGNGDILQVSFLDVGQGDAIYIRAPNGNDVLIDGGVNDSVLQRLREVMPIFDRDLDLVIATHPDADHITGLSDAFAEYEVKKFLHSEISSDTQTYKSLMEHVKNEADSENILARRGQRFLIDKEHGVSMDILFPDQDTSNFKESNDASIVARLVYGNKSFMLTGDSPSSIEKFIGNADGTKIQSTVLKLGHHGSKTSSSDAFLDLVKPEYAIVSAGKNNKYKHPNVEVIERVKKRNIPILSTIDEGTIEFETDGKTLWIK